jgi:hypothetical protein
MTAPPEFIEGTCKHCGATMLFYPADQRIAHRVPECDAYRAEMDPKTKTAFVTALDEEGHVAALNLFELPDF